MITQAIERALISGKGILKTHLHATSAVGKITIPANNFAIITSLTVYPFTSTDNIEGLSLAELEALSNIVVEFATIDSPRQGFIFRNNFARLVDPETSRTYLQNSEPITFDTYMVHSKDVYIQFGIYPGINGAAALDAGALFKSQIPTSGKGYGTTNVLRSISLVSPIRYAPAGFPDSGVSVAPGIPVYVEALPDYTAPECRLNPTITSFNSRLPLINVQYVLMNEQARKDFQ